MPLTPFDDLLDDLRDGNSDHLLINDTIDPISFHEILDAIREAPKVTKLGFSASDFDKDDVEQLFEVVALHPELKELKLSNAPIDGTGALQLVNALSNVEGLRVLKLNDCLMGDEAMQPITEWISKQDELVSIEMRGNSWSQDSHDRLAWSIRNNTNLTRLDIRHADPQKDNHAFEMALLHKPHPNFFMTDIKSTEINRLTSHNHRYMALTEQFITNKVHGPKQDYPTIAAKLKPEYLFNAESHRAVVKYRQQNQPDYMRAYDAFLEQMPTLSEDQPVTLAALMQPDAEGLTPLENPLVWKQHPDLLAQLAAQGDLTETTLQRETPRGTCLLKAAFAYRPAAETLKFLNDKGITVNQEQLLGEDSEQQKLVELLTMKGEISALFTPKNWQGAEINAPQHLRDALPENSQAQVPSLLRLTQTLRMEKRQQNMGGIGR